jgi:hypothetical protein
MSERKPPSRHRAKLADENKRLRDERDAYLAALRSIAAGGSTPKDDEPASAGVAIQVLLRFGHA